MPSLDSIADEDISSMDTARILMYARGKVGKSSYVFRTAAEKFNVIYWDFDGAAGLIKDVPEEHRKRFFYLPLYGRVENIITILKTLVANKGRLVYDFDRHRCVALNNTMEPDDLPVTYVDLGAADRSTISVTDSWTRICHSIVMQDTGVDYNDIDKLDYAAQEYNKMYRTANGIALWFSRMNCHTVMLAHEQEYIKYKAGKSMLSKIPQGMDASANIESVLMQPESIGAKHSPTFASFFNQTFRLIYDATESKRLISTAYPAGGSLVDFGSTTSLSGASGAVSIANMPFAQMMAKAKLIPKSVQPLSDVVRDTTLGELRAALSAGKQPPAKAVVDLSAFSK